MFLVFNFNSFYSLNMKSSEAFFTLIFYFQREVKSVCYTVTHFNFLLTVTKKGTLTGILHHRHFKRHLRCIKCHKKPIRKRISFKCYISTLKTPYCCDSATDLLIFQNPT